MKLGWKVYGDGLINTRIFNCVSDLLVFPL